MKPRFVKEWRLLIYRNCFIYWDTFFLLYLSYNLKKVCSTTGWYLFLNSAGREANSVDPWSDTAFCGVWSVSTLFAQACLSWG